MAPKQTTARMSLTSFTQPAMQPQRQQATLHTLEITVDNVLLDSANGESYAALRVVVADGNSVSAGAPAKYHGLNTFSPRSLVLVDFPDVPNGVVEVAAGMVPPEAGKNPYRGVSWIWMNVAYGNTVAAQKRAAGFVADKAVAVITGAVLDANLKVPAENGKSAWSAKSAKEGGRVRLTRTGDKQAGGTYEISELFNLKLRVASDVPQHVRKTMNKFSKQFSALVTLTEVKPGLAFPGLMPVVPTPASSQTRPIPIKHAKKTVRKSAMKNASSMKKSK